MTEFFHLAIFGYVRINEQKMNLFMIIPMAIPQLIYNFYPKLHSFELFNEKAFKFDLSMGNSKIVGIMNDDVHKNRNNKLCDSYLVYLNCLDHKQSGYNKGVHYVSIICKWHGDCTRHIGIISSKKKQYTEMPDLSRIKYDDNGNQKHELTLWPANMALWTFGDTTTLKLDCDNNTITIYYMKFRCLKGWTKKIQPNQTWHFVIHICNNRKSQYEVVYDDAYELEEAILTDDDDDDA